MLITCNQCNEVNEQNDVACWAYLSRSQCRRRVALGTGDLQVNHSEALGGQQDSMAFIKIRLVRLFTALALKTRKKRAIFKSEETKMLRARKKKVKQTTKFISVTYV